MHTCMQTHTHSHVHIELLHKQYTLVFDKFILIAEVLKVG